MNNLSGILPFYHKEHSVPKYYERSDTQFTRLALDKFFKPRGIYNKELTALGKHLPSGAYIAGGFIASILSRDKKPSDVDIFFGSPGAFETTYNLFMNPPQDESGWVFHGYTPDTSFEELADDGGEVRVVNMKSEDPNKLPFQLIKMVWYDNAEAVIDSFDFTVTQFCVDGSDMVLNAPALLYLFNSSLVPHKHQFPMESLYRLVKYTRKGYKVSPRTLQTMVEAIRQADNIDPPLPFAMY